MTIMPEWHKHLCEAVGWIQTRYHHIGRKTGAPFLAVVYPPEIEQDGIQGMGHSDQMPE